MDIKHVVVLMLENRSFDCMLGMLRPGDEDLDGLSGHETNVWQPAGGASQTVSVWNDPTIDAQAFSIPDPDPGESFADIAQQIGGVNGVPPMGGFVANYMAQPAGSETPRDPRAVMHYFVPYQVPVISRLAAAFGVADRWHAAAPCQTWPNRFFAHAGTSGGSVDNTRLFEGETVFNRLQEAGQSWRVYFHDIPQAAALERLFPLSLTHFLRFDHFLSDAASGRLPAYSFIEPRYFDLAGTIPNDQHPPHNVAYGELLIAAVYNALRASPLWRQSLLIITYDEHGGCYDHVLPPEATPPGDDAANGFRFDRFGVRVPAVLVSPYVRAGSLTRPSVVTPFDHTSIIATLRGLFRLGPLTPRDAAAPSLLETLMPTPDNDGPASIIAPKPSPASAAMLAAQQRQPMNDLQRSLATMAPKLIARGMDVAPHVAARAGEAASPR
jgi:phospholipase C